jgi:hypothetical protein
MTTAEAEASATVAQQRAFSYHALLHCCLPLPHKAVSSVITPHSRIAIKPPGNTTSAPVLCPCRPPLKHLGPSSYHPNSDSAPALSPCLPGRCHKARGVSQSVAPVILPSPRPRGLRPRKTAPKGTLLIQSRHDERGAESGPQAQRARRARHLRRRRLSARARQGSRGSGPKA